MEANAENMSFRERKQAQLSVESQSKDPNPVVEETPSRTPSEIMESAQDLKDDGTQTLQAGEEYEEESEGLLDSDLDNETPASDPEDEPTETHDWEKRYSDLRSEYDRSNANRTEMEQEHAGSMSENLKLRFDLEDNLSEAQRMSEFMVNTMTGNANQFRNINWSQVPPDKIQEVQAQAQNAMMMEQQAKEAYGQIKSKADETREMLRGREAQIAHTRLSRSIPGWSDKQQNVYGDIHDFATRSGMPSDTFKDITDPVVIEWAHQAMQMQGASKSVTTQTTRRPKAPRGKNAAVQPRTADGKFRQAAKAYQKNPSRQSFRDKTHAKLNAEKGR